MELVRARRTSARALACIACMLLAPSHDGASAYVVVSRCDGARCADAPIAWARNPKTGSTVVVEDVLGIFAPRARKAPLVDCGGGRLNMTTRHEVGCVAPCPPRAPLALAPFATRADANETAALIGADLRFTVVREPVDRFASAWAYLQARHADVWGRDRVDAFVEALYDGAGAAGLTAANLVALRGNHTIALWPQSYWVDAVLANKSGTAALVCYDKDALVDDVVALFADEFGCARTAAPPRGNGTAEPPRENERARDVALAPATERRIRALYARDAYVWETYCGAKVDGDADAAADLVDARLCTGARRRRAATSGPRRRRGVP